MFVYICFLSVLLPRKIVLTPVLVLIKYVECILK